MVIRRGDRVVGRIPGHIIEGEVVGEGATGWCEVRVSDGRIYIFHQDDLERVTYRQRSGL